MVAKTQLPQVDSAEPCLGLGERFFHSEVIGSMLLLACTLAAMAWANSPWADLYDRILHAQIGLWWNKVHYSLSVHHWINDGLMAVFFFVVGLEIKRELAVGHLSSLKKASLPVMAAVGGMVIPALFYALFNAGKEGSRGWGVPMATDIAFSLGVLALLGKRVPTTLKVLLTAAAIADDMGAVAVIALAYTSKIQLAWLVLAGVLLVLLYLAAWPLRIRNIGVLLALAGAIWVAVFASGVHATVAGILVAMVVPVRPRAGMPQMIELAKSRLRRLAREEPTPESMMSSREQLETAVEIEEALRRMQPPGLRMERYLHPYQVFLILPLFALANAGVSLDQGAGAALASPVSMGIIFGLVLGKPVGFMLFGWLTVRTGGGALPEGVNWLQFLGMSCLAGIGFTMSLFVSDLAFASPTLTATAKLGILAASLLSAVAGYFLLRASLGTCKAAGLH